MSISPFVAEITILPYTFAPRGYIRCDGVLVPISQQSTVFAIIGTIYGGDGRVSFAVPNLKGRSPMHWGTAPGLSTHIIGGMGGESSVTLTTNELPVHTHDILALAEPGPTNDVDDPSVTFNMAFDAASGGNAIFMYSTTGIPNQDFSSSAVAVSGAANAHANRQPYLAMNFCMAMDGVFPSRN